MKSQTLSVPAMILLAPLVVLAFQAQAEQVRNRELKNKSFTAGSLKITLTRFFVNNIYFLPNLKNDAKRSMRKKQSLRINDCNRCTYER